MRVKKINYLHLDKTLDKFYLLCKLIPGVKVSKINKKGIVTIIETKGFLFFKKKVRKHIHSMLFTDIIECLSIKLWGNSGENIIKFYREKLKESLIYNKNEILNIQNIVDLLYNEWIKRTLSEQQEKKVISVCTPIIKNKINIEENNEEIVKEIPNLLDIGILFGINKLKSFYKKTTITISLVSLINSGVLFIKNKTKYNCENFRNGMRAPPIHILGVKLIPKYNVPIYNVSQNFYKKPP